jgi:methylthioribose-1-phosphate isomerase
MKKLKGKSMEWDGEKLILIDQRYLPLEEIYFECTDYRETAISIKDMIVRGAPAIGATAAFGFYLGTREFKILPVEEFKEKMKEVKETLASTRPTAVNLFWALDRMEKRMETLLEEQKDLIIVSEKLCLEALLIAEEDIMINKMIGEFGSHLLKDGDTVLTHCNAGALATVDYGTALGVIRAAVEKGKNIKVYADETRPYLQGARLTVWELMQDEIDTTLITDNMAGWVMKQGKIDAIIVGADRIAANGDTANKIGTYSVAVLAKEHNIPFYVAAPLSTIDMNTESGDSIPIEERTHNEVRFCHKTKMVHDNVKVFNPSFDVTPNDYVTAIITEKGVIEKPYNENLKKLFS